MVNVIKMELYRLFRTKSLYVTAAVCAGVIILLVMLTSALINIVTDVSASDLTVSMSDSAEGTTVSVSDTASQSGGTNPADFCSGFISGLCGIFVVIFTAIFIHGFYRDGYSKNVIACVKYRWYFQVSKAVCIAVYSAVILAVASVVSLIMSAISLNSFEFEYMGVFFQFLLGEFFLLNAIGLLSAFLTELTYSKVTAIVYILLASTNLISGMLSLLEDKINDIFHTQIELWKLLPSLYQGSFRLGAPDTSGNGEMLAHAIVLSVVFIAIYNAAGAYLITKRDVK